MILDSITKSLEVILAAAVATAQPVWYVAWADHTPVAFTPGAGDGLTNGTTAVTAVAAPTSGIQRQIKLFSLFNNDTAAVTATVRINNNGTFRILVKVTLAVGDTLEWDPANGWKVITSSGTIKSGVGPAGATGEIQFNNSGVLGSDPDLLWDSVSNELRFGSVAKARMTGQNRFRHLSSMVRAFASADQTVTTATQTVINLAGETFDTDTMHDTATNNNRLVAPIAGKYLVYAQATLFIGGLAGTVTLRIRNQAATVLAVDIAKLAVVTDQRFNSNTSTIVSMVANDWIEMTIEQDTGSDRTLMAGTTITFMYMIYIGE